MAQFARPDADTVIENFVDAADGTSSIFQSIDETSPSDADYIKSPASPVDEVYVCRLSDVVDPVSSAGHVMRMRTSVDVASQEMIDFTQELRQGYVNEGSQGTLIATNSRIGVTSTSWTDTSHVLSSGEADAITDYTALFYRFVVAKQ